MKGEIKMVAGHLQKKSGYYYAVLSWYKNGKKKVKWFSTGLPVEGNYKKAEEKLQKWVLEKQKTTYVRINEDWVKCDFKYPGWIKK